MGTNKKFWQNFMANEGDKSVANQGKDPLEQGLEEDVIESGYEEFVTTEINTMDVSKIFIPMAKQNENLVEPAQKIIEAIRNGEETIFELTSLLNSITTRIPSLFDSSRRSVMPSIFFVVILLFFFGAPTVSVTDETFPSGERR